jgi:hypothetical protein
MQPPAGNTGCGVERTVLSGYRSPRTEQSSIASYRRS